MPEPSRFQLSDEERTLVADARRIRHGAAEAEVWPGSWTADRITIADPAPPQP